ncbi:MAG: (d)CMP kinase [Candidatus Omnitrophica bacterium]|nr:(d)CMP kinase [Candidatus Omnitrophota bacterium]
MINKIYVIAMDGPAGAGKSTVAKRLAKELGFAFLDTGAMYRSIALKALREKINMEDEDVLVVLAKRTNLDLKDAPNGVQVIMDGEDVSKEIRTLEVTNNTFYVARAGKVREILVEWQRQIAGRRSIVTEGRDVTTVVFPNATHKFYMDASVEERTQRRYKELKDKGQDVDIDQLRKEIEERDHKDFSRKVGPLRRAEDAVYIDSSKLSIDEVVETLRRYIGI